MGHTLDELLDAAGISDLEPAGLAKSAADGAVADDDDQLLKLAERCERAATQPSAPPTSDKHRALAEKTAAIAVIAATLAEIEAIGGRAGEKLASDEERTAAFIERALGAGHPPDEIARFLKQAGMWGTAERAGQAIHRGMGVSSQRLRELGETLTTMAHETPAVGDRLVRRIRSNHGDHLMWKILDHAGPAAHRLSEVEKLKSLPRKAVSVRLGGKEHGLTAAELKTVGIPAATGAVGLAAGRALAHHDGDEKKSHDDARS